MQHSVHELTAIQFTRGLKGLKEILKKAQSYASDRKFDENNFLQLRLAPDMFPLVRQVQITTDTAKGAVARLSGKTPPSFPDEEKTMAELIARVDRTIGYLREFSEKDFGDYTQQKISFPWKPAEHLMGADFLSSHAIPNFYFHLATTYALFRLHGLPIGKSDYLGEQNWKK